MRPLHRALLEAQNRGAGTPFLPIVFRRREGGVERLRFTRWYQGSEPAGPHAIASPEDGSLVRARIAGGQLLYQRVTSPNPTSDFSSWTALGPAHRAVALAAKGHRLLLAYIQNDAVLVRESSDYGATLSAPSVVVPAPTGAIYLAAALGAEAEAAIFLATSSQVSVVRKSGGTWGSPAAWPHSLASISGLAAHHQGDYNLVVTGADSAGQAAVWALAYGDGYRWPKGTWSPMWVIQVAHAGSQVFFSSPSLVLGQVYRLCFLESFQGVVPYSRVHLTHMPLAAEFSDALWREPLPTDVGEAIALAIGPGSAWLSTPSGLWNAPLPGPSLEAQGRLLAMEVQEEPFGGHMRLLLDDSEGLLRTAGLVEPGVEVEVGIGYQTAAGPLASPLPCHWVEEVVHRWEGGRALLEVLARPFWWLVETFRARRQYAWAEGEANIFGLLATILGRAGVPFSALSYSGEAVNLRPAFALHPGQSALQAVRRLLAMVPDVLVPVGPYALLKEPQLQEPPVYSYGDGHPIVRAWRRLEPPPANRVQVFGKGVFQEGFLWESVGQVGDRLAQVRAPELPTATDVQGRLEAELGRLRRTPMALLETPPNCGLELYDVVEVVETPALPPGRYRVMAIRTVFNARRGQYRQTISLAPP
ncbi:MAG: hypothetical protein RQ985_01985 [Dehalococcoidia bacterium]|nr:hypothetical protein [Dehalococcoidia bacterium]